jgi:NADH-quinone oxidoreductase subunit H
LSFLFYLAAFLCYMILAIYAERKVSAFIQDRLGPMETGPYGLLQTVADLLKLLQKEDIVPFKAQRLLFLLAPVLAFVAVFAGFSVLPVGEAWSGATLHSGVFFMLAVVSLDVFALVMAGWSSGNKYSTLGAFRAAAQLLSYEVPLGLSVLTVCVVAGTVNLHEISIQQGVAPPGSSYLLGITALPDVSAWGGFFTWNVMRMPILFLVWIIFFVASLAESNRAPFDLPEAESELVAGIQTEYSGFRWAAIMMAEYAMMLLVSIIGVILFFGSWYSPLPNLSGLPLAQWTNGAVGTWQATAWGIFWLIGKAMFLVLIQIWVRWTFPRLRINQLMSVCWKYLTPFALFFLLVTAVWKLLLV